MNELFEKFRDMLDRDAASLNRSDYRNLLEKCEEECDSRLLALELDEQNEKEQL